MEFFIEPIPVWAMCYLINGDSTISHISGLSVSLQMLQIAML